MELTKEERNQVYKNALDMFLGNRSPSSPYVCDCLHDSIRLIDRFKKQPFDERLLSEQFQEFSKQKPVNIIVEKGVGWWDKDDEETRIKALTKCIEDTNP